MSKKFKNKHYKGGHRHYNGYCDPKTQEVYDEGIDEVELALYESIFQELSKLSKDNDKNRKFYKPMITLEERDFLKHVVRPFRDVIKSISIQKGGKEGSEFLSIAYIADDRQTRFITFPAFNTRRQYKGLERGVDYRLNDLDL